MKLLKEGNEVAFTDFQIQEKQMIGTLSVPLENGTYKIQWSIVGEDGHPIEREINFVVQKEQTETTDLSPYGQEGNTEENTDANSEQQNTEEQENNEVISKETNEQTQDDAGSSTTFKPVLIGIVVILGIGLLLITRKKK
jgi:copper resistance protein C